jgi:hypothetical protein
LLAWLVLSPSTGQGFDISGRVIDAVTRQPVAGALVTTDKAITRTDSSGSFRIDSRGATVGVRAYGYWRNGLPLEAGVEPIEIELQPISPHAVHLPLSGIDDPVMRESLVGLHAANKINTLVIEVKDAHGTVAVPQLDVEDEARERAGETTMHLEQLVQALHSNGIYAIARIAVFKDDVLATRHPELALNGPDAHPVREVDGMAWVDPNNQTVWEYNIAAAVEAARLGFDEIQFDCVRFPALSGTALAMGESSADRRRAVQGFLAAAKQALQPYNVFVAADIFGYASWDPGDTNVGQKLEDVAAEVDYICLMLYPSAFKTGLPGWRMPLDHPDKIVELSLRRAEQRTALSPVRFRPWLQAFPDFRFDGRPFKRQEILAQTRAAEAFGADGWMLWNSQSAYAAEDLP